MFEVNVRSAQGWLPITCGCAAARAVFVTEQAATEAIDHHLTGCIPVQDLDDEARDFLRSYYRPFAVEAIPA